MLFVTVNHFAAQRKVVREMFGPPGPYEAPTYKYSVRGDGYPGNPDIENFFFFVQLKCTMEKPRCTGAPRPGALLHQRQLRGG